MLLCRIFSLVLLGSLASSDKAGNSRGCALKAMSIVSVANLLSILIVNAKMPVIMKIQDSTTAVRGATLARKPQARSVKMGVALDPWPATRHPFQLS